MLALILVVACLFVATPECNAFVPNARMPSMTKYTLRQQRIQNSVDALFASGNDSRGKLPPAIVAAIRNGERIQQSLPPQEQPILPPPPRLQTNKKPKRVKAAAASKRNMLKFALPALGIFLCNPLLSNIDNAFVGKTTGTMGLAALSPATICTDQMLYMFSFLGRATTGLVSRSYDYDEATKQGNTTAAREAASAPLSVALLAGFVVTGFYAKYTSSMLSLLKVEPTLRGPAASYIHWRGAIAWAAMAQNVMLNILLATRDAITPLKIVALAAFVNVIGDATCCAWPFRMGCGGAAAATAFATLFSSAFMMRSLWRKNVLPSLKLPTRQEIMSLLEFTGPLVAITVTRLLGTINMQRAASRLGVQQLAAYQMSINVMFLFMLFGEPLSQLSQTQLPALVDSLQPKGRLIRDTLKSILILAIGAAVTVGGVAALTLGLGTGMFSSDIGVQSLAKHCAPSLFCAVATGIFTGKQAKRLGSHNLSYFDEQTVLPFLGAMLIP